MLLNESKKHNENKRNAFIRDVRTGGEPSCVLASGRQLQDLKRFCCDETEFKPLTVDPTFDIGQFNVTPISYQHLLLETKEKKIKTMEPGLSNLMAFGADDGKALENAFNHNFEHSTHLLCKIHLKKNLERKLVELGITGQVKQYNF